MGRMYVTEEDIQAQDYLKFEVRKGEELGCRGSLKMIENPNEIKGFVDGKRRFRWVEVLAQKWGRALCRDAR